MGFWKTILVIIIIIAVLYILAPTRSERIQTSEDTVEIIYMGSSGPIAGSTDDAVRAFERESIIAHEKDPSRPKYRVISGQNAIRDLTADPTRFLTSVAGGMPPDVITFDRFAISEWASRNAFLPLDDFIKKDLEENHPDAIRPELFYKPTWDEACYKGKIYGIPNGADDRALIYNRDLFRREGLVDAQGEPLPPKTWDELREYARKLTQYDGQGNIKVLGLAPNYGNSWLYFYAFMNDAEVMNAEGTQCTINSQKVIEALEYMKMLYDDAGGYEKVLKFQSGFQGGTLDPLLIGKIAMKLDGHWNMNIYSQFGRDVDFGVAPAPVSPRMLSQGKTTVSWGGGFAYAIPTNAVHKKEAWDFIRFMMSERAFDIMNESDRETIEAQGRLFIPFLMNPIIHLNEKYYRMYVLNDPRMPERIKKGYRTFMDLMPECRFRPITPVGQLLWNQHVVAMEEALYNRKTPKEALDYSAMIVQRELDNILHPVEGKPVPWTLFFIMYGIMIILLMVGAFLWDTSLGFRKRFARMIFKKREVGIGEIVEGTRSKYFRSDWYAGFLFVSPWFMGFIIFGGGPLLFSILMSFCEYDVINPAKWIGLENFRFFFKDELIPKAIWNTVFMVIGVPLTMAASLAIALVLNMKIRGVGIWRTIFYLPAIMPAVAMFILWIWILNPAVGLLNQTLSLAGIHGPNWLGSETWSKPSFILIGLWGAGGGMLIWLAGLKNIPEQYYEAAAIDGANHWKQFIYITLPMLTPYIFFNLIMGLIGVLQIFDIAYIMTNGGPANSTLFYVYHLFNNAFRFLRMGYASSMAWLLFIVILILTIIQLRLAKYWVHYEGE